MKSVVVIVWHAREPELIACLESLEGIAGARVVVDVSEDGRGIEVARLHPDVQWVDGRLNRGYGWACNLGLDAYRRVTGSIDIDVVVFSNADVVFEDAAFDLLVEAAKASEGIVAPVQLTKAGNVSSDTLLPWPTYSSSLARWLYIGRRSRVLAKSRKIHSYAGCPGIHNVASNYALSGACLAMPAPLHSELQGFDESFFLYEEDVDLSYRSASAGFPLSLVSTARIVHDSGTSRRGLNEAAMRSLLSSERRLYRKMGKSPRVIWTIQRLGLLARVLGSLAEGRGAHAVIWFGLLVKGR